MAQLPTQPALLLLVVVVVVLLLVVLVGVLCQCLLQQHLLLLKAPTAAVCNQPHLVHCAHVVAGRNHLQAELHSAGV